jgi:hypothetical protein
MVLRQRRGGTHLQELFRTFSGQLQVACDTLEFMRTNPLPIHSGPPEEKEPLNRYDAAALMLQYWRMLIVLWLLMVLLTIWA